jgi:CMP-N-acetylneuraminic acid synthetase
MNIGLVIGKKNSSGVPGKNVRPILGRPTAEYAFIAASAANIDKVYVSTDSDKIAQIGAKYGANHILRPDKLATRDALTEDVLTHAYEFIKDDLGSSQKLDTISLLFCNNPAIDVNILNEAIDFTTRTSEFDSCFSVGKYDMFSPSRARRLTPEGEMRPFVDLKYIENVSSIRDSQGSVYFCDLSIQVMKPRCFEKMDEGQQPFKWQGRKSKAIEVDFGFDIDTEWQFVVIEYWLKKHGFTESTIPWKKNA